MATEPNLNDDTVLATHLRDLLYRSVGFDDVESTHRLDALKYYFQRPRGDEEEGASKVVSGDLSAMTDATVAQMTEAFATDDIAEFDAFDKDDEHQARLEMDVVHHQIMNANNGILHFITSIKEALLFRLGVIKVWSEELKRSRIKEFENIPNREALAAFSADRLPNNVKVDLLDFDLEKGTAKIRETIIFRQLRIRPVPSENFGYLEDESSEQDMQRRSFVWERHIETRSKLIEQGFDKATVDKLPCHIVGRTRETVARTPGQTINQVTRGLDRSQDLIEWFEIYALVDMDGDGIAERWKFSLNAQQATLLDKEPVDLVPYGTGVTILNPHKLRGVSLYDKLRQTQDIRTGLKRALLDNATVINQGRIAYLDGKVNVDDLDSRRADRSIRVTGVASIDQALKAIEIPDLSQGLLANIQNERQERAEMGGAALEMATGQLRLNERLGSMGLDRAYSVMEQLSAHMTLMIAITLFRSVYLLAHETIRKNFSESEVVFKRRGRWDSVDPSTWPRRTGLTFKISKSPNERSRKVSALRETLGMQLQMAQLGMDEVLVNLDGFHHALIDFSRANDLPNPEKYWIDPLDPNSIKARQLKSQGAAQEKEKQDRLMGMAVELEQLRIAFDKYRQDTMLQFEYFRTVLESEVEEAKIVGDATVDLLKAKRLAGKVDSNGKSKPNGSQGTEVSEGDTE